MDEDSAPYISKKQKPNSELVHAEYPCKFYNKFSFKTVLVVIFLAALALFPLEAPEIISQTGTWELVQLLLVGVAVSYGLFSRKSSDDDDKTENEYIDSSKFDNVQSRLLEVSSFFENHQVSDDSRIQTWNNYQYSSGKPLVVVAKESDAIISSRIVEKPLLLPLRSLKSPISTATNSPKSMISSPRKIDHASPPPLQLPPIVKTSTLLKSSSIVTDGSSLRRSTRSVPFELRDKNAFKGKSVRTIRPFIGAARARVYAKNFINGKTEDEGSKEVDTQIQVLEPALKVLSGEEKKVESDEDSDDYVEESSENVEEASKNVSDNGPENVDKKADEFIAKFREQIKLQRSQSIRTSAGQPAKKLLQ